MSPIVKCFSVLFALLAITASATPLALGDDNASLVAAPVETYNGNSNLEDTKSPTKGPTKGPSYLHGTQTGDGTFFTPALGACGYTNGPSEHVVAVSHLLYDTYPGYAGGNPNNNPVCGKKIKATYHGKNLTVTVVDRCTGCEITDLDFAHDIFPTFAPLVAGRIHGVKWVWV